MMMLPVKRRTVLVVDADPLARVGIRSLLQLVSDVAIVGEASAGEDVMQALAATPADVVLMDIALPGVSGFAATSAIKARHPEIVVVLMSSAQPSDMAIHATNAGADAYVTKTVDVELICAAIRGGVSPRARVDGPRQYAGASLSRRELWVANRVSEGVGNHDIAAELNLSVNTVNTYVSRAMAKVGAANRVQLANRVRAVTSPARTGGGRAGGEMTFGSAT